MATSGNSQSAHDLTEKSIQKLFRALLLSPNPRRDRAILRLFLHFGCSVRELIALEESDVDLAAGRIRWRLSTPRKWSDLPQPALRDLADYIKRERRARCARLFTSRLGHPLTRVQVAKIFRFLQKETGMGELTPHLLRERHRRLIRQQSPAPLWLALRRGLPCPPAPAGDGEAAPAGQGDG